MAFSDRFEAHMQALGHRPLVLLREQVAAELNHPSRERAERMVLQLLRLSALKPNPADIRIDAEGRLLYRADGSGRVVWGDEEFEMEKGVTVCRPPQFIGGRPCWRELKVLEGQERIAWPGFTSPFYHGDGVDRVIDGGGRICYSVLTENDENELVGFVVDDGVEGRRYGRVTSLQFAGGRPVYRGTLLKPRRGSALVWGDREVCSAYEVAQIIVHDDVPYATVRHDKDPYLEELWRGHERLFLGRRARDMCVINGMLTFWTQQTDTDQAVITCGSRTHAVRAVGAWWTDRDAERDSGVLLYTERASDHHDDPGTNDRIFVNMREVGHGRVRMDEGRPYLTAAGVLHVTIRGSGKREYDLRQLGILP